MTKRHSSPAGAPCWADLWTAEAESSRSFYSALFGWEAGEPSPQFGGYFMFMREGEAVAGAMGPLPGTPADNSWKPYFCTRDIDAALKKATAGGAAVQGAAMPVADLGVQAVLTDPAGAEFELRAGS